MQQLPPSTEQQQPAPLSTRSSLLLPVVFGIINAVLAAGVIVLGVRYDDRDQTPGLLVWVGVLMILPQWLVFALLRAWQSSRNAAALRLAAELSTLAKRHGGVTGVIDVVEPMLPPVEQRGDHDPR
ncbi:MAG: hypothetical protein JNL82_14550 [Myxococcales bacterium]|nr:hypothetical protein [Myxococcales bacterium]